ncbi:hypothetical protein HHX47_DHR7000665 [Lentinula edodes]|nr:hypothetical protein HHX47_DHR7000665 [Lentinula edodes]
MTRRNARPALKLRTSYEKNANTFGLPSPDSLASSIPATCSPVTPEDAETFVFSSKESAETVALDDVFTGGRSYFQKTHYREDRTYLPPLSEVSDQPSRFSTTTTSTSNYIEVDLGEEDQINLSSKSLQDDLLPGDSHPAWIPQIFTVGFTKPSSYGPGRPEISEPFQLTPMRPPELKSHTLPSHFSLTSKSSSLLTRSRLHMSSSVAAANPTSSSTPSREDMSGTQLSPTASVRRGFSFGSGHIQRNDHSPPFSSTHSRNAEESSESSALGSVISRPQTPTRRPSITSVFGKLKSPRKGQSEPWVMVDVEVTPMIHQRLVTEY